MMSARSAFINCQKKADRQIVDRSRSFAITYVRFQCIQKFKFTKVHDSKPN